LAITLVKALIYFRKECATATGIGLRNGAAPDTIVNAQMLELVRFREHSYYKFTQRIIVSEYGKEQTYQMGIAIQLLHITLMTAQTTDAKHFSLVDET
jgi:hypothetical protein